MTEPHKSILNRDEALKKNISLITTLLDEIVNFETQVIQKCVDVSHDRNNKNIDLAIFHYYRHIIEMTDAVSSLVRSAIQRPSLPLIRSVFESLAYIFYLTEIDEEYEFRALAWIVGLHREKLIHLNSLDVSKAGGEKIKNEIENDILLNTEFNLPKGLLKPEIEHVESILALPEFGDTLSFFPDEMKKTRWYSVNGGPVSFYELVKHVDLLGFYRLSYENLSLVIHGADFGSGLEKVAPGLAKIKPLRSLVYRVRQSETV